MTQRKMASTHKMSPEMERLLLTFNEESEEIFTVCLPRAILALRQLLQRFQDQGLLALTYSRQVREAFQRATRRSDHAQSPPKITSEIKDDPESETNGKSVEAESKTNGKSVEAANHTVAKLSCTIVQDKPEEVEPEKKRKELDEAGAASLLREILEDDEGLTCSPVMRGMIASLKPFLSEGIRHSLGLNRWLSTHFTPSLTDDNAVMEESRKTISTDIHDLTLVCTELLRSLSTFNSKRAKTVCKILKHPTVTDYRAALRDDDEEMMIRLATSTANLTDTYLTLYDSLCKNMNQLQNYSKTPANFTI